MLARGGETFAIARPLRRPCPCDFEMVFVQIGRLACEEHYRAERDTITRWLNECGKDQLIEDRRAFVHWKRRLLRREGYIHHRKRKNTRPIPHTVVMAASRFLSADRLTVAPAGEGQWRVGAAVLEPVEMVAFASSLGFDPLSTLSPAHVLRQIWARP